MVDHRKVLRAIFDEAAELAPGESRRAFLDQACVDNTALRAEVEELLRSQEMVGGFLADPKREGPAMADPVTEREGDRIGRYKLLQKIGEGGCGVVYMAEQTEPVRRRVALKVIKLGMDTQQVVARFEAERQALAMMDHPNIAKVLDAGATGGRGQSSVISDQLSVIRGQSPVITGQSIGGGVPGTGRGRLTTDRGPLTTGSGRPYFVMELVRGIKITDYCEQNHLSTTARIRLFILVCQAVQHAHQKGIIHRDLKPSNILVTSDDGVPLPKVIDFGIAKATADIQLTDKTLFTRFDMFIGTPAYMSPEQAEFNASDVDTRTDIYALGVLLYELMTGKTPFDGTILLKSGLEAMRRTIRETEPVRPSTRLTQELVAVDARAFQSPAAEASSKADLIPPARDTGRLLRLKETIDQLRGDLDWIVLKALEKDRTRRYETASAFAADLQRYLANEPVVARPPSTAYKFRKAWQRNKLAFAAATAVALALVVGITVSTWQAVEAMKARQIADVSRAQAKTDQRIAETARASESAQRQLAEARAYAADMNLAQQALTADDLELATELLDRHQPQPGQTDRRGWEWRYLRQQSRSDALYTLCEQTEPIVGLSVSHDGKWVAIRTVGGQASVWNLASRREVLRPEGSWNALTFAPTKPLLALWNLSSPGMASWLTYWDAETGTYLSPPPPPDTGRSAWKHGLTFLPDGLSVMASTLKALTIWRVSDGKELAAHSLDIDGSGIGFPMGVAHNAQRVAVGESGRRIRVIDVAQGSEVFRATTSGTWIESVALSGDGRRLATSSGTDETVIHLWDVAGGRELGVLEGHRGFVSALVFWPDGKTLASAGADKTIRIWDVEQRRPLKVLRGQPDEIRRLSLLPDNSTLISGGKRGTVMVWANVTVRRQQATTLSWRSGPHQRVPGAQHYDWAAHWSLASGGDALLTLDRNGWLRRRNGQGFQASETLFQVDPNPQEVRFSKDHRWLATHTETGEIKIWDVSQGKWSCDLPLTNGPVSLGSFLTDASKLAVWNTNALTLTLYDVAAGHPTASWSYSDSGAGRVEIPNDGRWCLTRGADGTGQLRELSNGRVVGSVPLAGSLRGTFSPDGKQLAMAYRSGWVRRWEVPSLTEREPFRGFSSALGGFASVNERTMTFSPDGRRLAVGSASYSMRLWDVESGRPMLTFPGEVDHSVSLSAAFSADGSTIVVLHALGTFDIWRAPTWEDLAVVEARGFPVPRRGGQGWTEREQP